MYVEGHGCSASFADTEILTGLITVGGFELAENEEEADVSVIVTCSVKTVTEQRMLSRIQQLSDGGRRKVVVAGCLPKINSDKILKIDPNLSMLGPGNLDKIVPTLVSTLAGKRITYLESSKLIKLGMPRTRKNEIIGVVEIASGCLSSCTFCQVKLIKGVVFSYPEERILLEVKSLIHQGSREIWLTSTDNACYGRDSHSSLPEIIRKVALLEGDFRIRVGMMNPTVTQRILEDLIEVYHNEKVFKFLHLPVQSGNDRILKEMQRGYSVQNFCEMVSSFRAEHPWLTLSTDIIVSFPSETETEFQDSMELLRKIKPDVVNLSRFGARFGTKAAKMDKQIDSSVAKDRSSRMTFLLKEIARKSNERWRGWRGEILIDELGRDALIGRNFAYKSCVLKDSFFGANDIERRKFLGKELQVKVVGATASTLSVEPMERDLVFPI